jgi:hypothetical protein
MNSRFIYDEKTSSLYAPDGTFLKIVSCPKAKNWNQLLIEEGEKRWRKCEDCHENVIDLDALETNEAIKLINNGWSTACIHASRGSENVIFLKDENAIPPLEMFETDDEDRIIIKTVRTIDDINRAASMGYEVDIRRVFYETQKLRRKMTIGKDDQTGQIATSGDYRDSFRTSTVGSRTNTRYREIVPFFSYYPYFQAVPVAAYLIPKATPDGTKVLIEDPIEDFVGSSWNQGDCSRAAFVYGHIENKKVVIHELDISVLELIG